MKKASILICDDETGVRESLKLILERDYNLDYVHHGKEAVEYLRKSLPDLVIMDIKMPHMNGLDALKSIRRIRRHVPILMITGYESSDVAAQAIRLGASDYLTKPFERERVWEKVETLLSLPRKKRLW